MATIGKIILADGKPVLQEQQYYRHLCGQIKKRTIGKGYPGATADDR